VTTLNKPSYAPSNIGTGGSIGAWGSNSTANTAPK